MNKVNIIPDTNAQNDSNTFGILSFIFGVLSFFIPVISSILAIVFYFQQRKIKKNIWALLGLIFGIAGLITYVVVAFLVIWTLSSGFSTPFRLSF